VEDLERVDRQQLFSRYSGTKPPMSSREKPNVICVRSFVPRDRGATDAYWFTK
jgi:hypothetical protein